MKEKKLSKKLQKSMTAVRAEAPKKKVELISQVGKRVPGERGKERYGKRGQVNVELRKSQHGIELTYQYSVNVLLPENVVQRERGDTKEKGKIYPTKTECALKATKKPPCTGGSQKADPNSKPGGGNFLSQKRQPSGPVSGDNLKKKQPSHPERPRRNS